MTTQISSLTKPLPKAHKYRSREQVIGTILHIVAEHRGIKRSRLQYEGYLSTDQVKKFTTFMVGIELLHRVGRHILHRGAWSRDYEDIGYDIGDGTDEGVSETGSTWISVRGDMRAWAYRGRRWNSQGGSRQNEHQRLLLTKGALWPRRTVFTFYADTYRNHKEKDIRDSLQRCKVAHTGSI